MVTLTLANYEAIKYACMNFHYAKRVPNCLIAFNVYQDDEWCGVIAYGHGANPNIAEPYGKWTGQVLELLRVALNGKQKTTSECVALSLKELKRYCPLVDLVVSYADGNQGHIGTIYQATNWIYEGEFAYERGILVCGELTHRRTVSSRYGTGSIAWLKKHVDQEAKRVCGEAKHKYLYPLNKKMRKKVQELAQEYPKE